MIDQDQSDNVTIEYLLNGNGQTAQANTANMANLAGATPLLNGSDDVLSDRLPGPDASAAPRSRRRTWPTMAR